MNPYYENEVKEELARLLHESKTPADSKFQKIINRRGCLPIVVRLLESQQKKLLQLYREKMR